MKIRGPLRCGGLQFADPTRPARRSPGLCGPILRWLQGTPSEFFRARPGRTFALHDGQALCPRVRHDARVSGSMARRQPYVYEAGTLLLDFVDTRTNRVVWRGWAEGSVESEG